MKRLSSRPSLVLLPVLAGALALAACGDDAGVNPPTEPAQPISAPGGPAGATSSGSVAPLLPGAGPTSFVGRWASNPAWCAAPSGQNRPVEITPLRFEGYENSCAITHIDPMPNGYLATLRCQSEGTTRTERVAMSSIDDTLTLTYVDRSRVDGREPSIKLLKCTTLKDTATSAPALPTP